MTLTAVNLQDLNTIRAALERLGQGVTVFDADLRLVGCNGKFLEMLGFPEHLGTPGTPFSDFMRYNAVRGEYGPGDIDAQVDQRVEQAKRFEPHSFDRTRPDGTIIHVEGSPTPDGGFVTVYSDVTLDRNREAELERRVQARTKDLQESQARLNLIANEVKAGIVLLDANLVITYANLRFSRAYGMAPDQIIGKSSKEILPPNTFREAYPHFNLALHGEAPDFDQEITLPDGRRKYVRTFLRPEASPGGEISGFYVLSVDLTRQKAADEALAQAQKMEALGRLSAGIAHDFNNLLTIVIGNLSPLTEKMAGSNLVAEYIDPSLSAARRGSALTGRLLTLARRQQPRREMIRAYSVLDDVAEILRSSLPADVTLHVPKSRNDPWVLADRGQLEMSLINLAVNAREALKGQGQISMSCDTAEVGSEEAGGLKIKSGKYCRIRVEDTGCGMTEPVLKQIFDPFYSGKPDHGSGLGLAMVYAFIEQAGGTIQVESQPDIGTRFTLLLPFVEKPDDPIDPERAAMETSITDRKPLTLLVEDNQDVRAVLRRQLLALGIPVVEAASAEEAVELLHSLEDVGLLMTDVGLPGNMSGSDLAHSVRTGRPDIAIVLMTGHGADSVIMDAPDGIPVLQKPFDTAELNHVLSDVLSERSLGG